MKRTNSKSADNFISVKSTQNVINCETQYPTNVPHYSSSTHLLFYVILFVISAQLPLSFSNDTSNLRLELRNCLWFVDRREILQTPQERSRTVSNRTTSLANSDRQWVMWHDQEIFLATTQLFPAQCDRMRRPAGNTSLPYQYHPTEATETLLSCCDNVRHSLLLHFRAHFSKSPAQSHRQPKIRTKLWLVVDAMAFHELLEDSPRHKSNSFVCSRTQQVESAPHR
jgi:hypothetical protein